MISARSKLLSWDALAHWRAQLKDTKTRLVVTNGCFDILHAGHISYLEAARNLGDALLVGLNSDVSVRSLKGPSRPINPQEDRALVLAALEAVSAVCLFEDPRASRFLDRAQPDIYAKGGDYAIETLDQDERRSVESHGGHIVLIPMLPGRSTTGLLSRLSTL